MAFSSRNSRCILVNKTTTTTTKYPTKLKPKKAKKKNLTKKARIMQYIKVQSKNIQTLNYIQSILSILITINLLLKCIRIVVWYMLLIYMTLFMLYYFSWQKDWLYWKINKVINQRWLQPFMTCRVEWKVLLHNHF